MVKLANFFKLKESITPARYDLESELGKCIQNENEFRSHIKITWLCQLFSSSSVKFDTTTLVDLIRIWLTADPPLLADI